LVNEESLEELREKIRFLENKLRNPVPIHRVQDVQAKQLRRDPTTIRAAELEEGVPHYVTDPADDKVYHVVRNKNIVRKVELT